MNIQAPPNLTPGGYPKLVAAGHQRLGRRLAGDARPREPRGAVAAPRPSSRAGARTRGQAAGRAAGDLSRLRARRRHAGSTRRCATSVLARDRRRRASRATTTGRRATPMPPPAPLALLARGRRRRQSRDAIARARDSGRAARRGRDRRACSRRAAPTSTRVAQAADALRRAGQRRRRELRRQPQHQLHQHLLLPLPASAPSPRARRSESLRGTPYDLGLDGGRAARARGLGARRDRSLPAGRHPSRLHRRDLPRDLLRAVKEAVPEHARPRLLAAGSDAGRGDARHCRRASSSRG